VSEAIRVLDVLRRLDRLAPPDLAESWDRVGLQVGRPDQAVARVIVALEVTDDVLAELGVQQDTLLVTHHPLLFRPLDAVRTDRPEGRQVAAVLAAGAALVACHTNWDKAPGGTDDALAEALGIIAPRPLEGASRPAFGVWTMVPEDDLDTVREAMAEAGAGASARYRRASFSVGGESTFEALAGAQPAHGAVGAFTLRHERRLEMVVDGERLAGVLRALLAAHPYEEPAYGVVALHGGWPFGGLGRVGDWPADEPVAAAAERVREALGAQAVRVVGDARRTVRRAASVGGSGRSLLARAAAAGADLVVTADIGHHDARLAEALGLAVVDAGHRETEAPGVHALAGRLRAALKDADVPVPVDQLAVASPFAFAAARPSQGR